MSCFDGRSGGPIGDCFPRPPPVCGSVCDNPCGSGCAPCGHASDVKWCSEGQVLRCRDSSCVEVVEVCPEADACVTTSCAKSVNDCGAVRDAYEAELGRATAAVVREGAAGLTAGEYGESCPGDCAVVAGDCAVGLETCWLVGWRSSEIERLAALYARLGCPGAKACNCPPLDVALTVTCRGVSSADGGVVHNACVARSSRMMR